MQFQTVWGPLIAWYLFLAGVGAGAYLVGFVAERAGERYSALARPGYILGAPLVAIGAALLLFHLGNPPQVWRAILRPYSSIMSLGLWILVVFLGFAGLHFGALLLPKAVKVSGRWMPWVKTLAAIFAVAVIIYTGLLLGVTKAIPFWNTPILPLLFLVSAISTGIGAVMLIVGGQQLLAPKARLAGAISEAVHSLSRVELPLIVTEVLVLFFLLFIMIAGSSTAAGSAHYLISGGYAVAFWLGLVVVGLLLPIILEALTLRRSPALAGAPRSAITVLTALCLLAGGLVLRYAILAAGATVAGTL